MNTNDYGLSVSDVDVLNSIIETIDDFPGLEEKMDYIDGLVLWGQFFDEYDDEVLDRIDSDLRDYIM